MNNSDSFWSFVVFIGIIIFVLYILDKKKKQNAIASINQKQSANEEQKKQIKKQEAEKLEGEGEYKSIQEKYKNYIEKYYELAEREVSTLDEWGDENWDVLDKLKKECIFRIAKSIYIDSYNKNKEGATNYINAWFSEYTWEGDGKVSSEAPYWVKMLYNHDLQVSFIEYHNKRKTHYKATAIDFNIMTGIDFENYLSEVLKQHGFNVSGTPVTGDQGADLIATKDNKIYVIQAKRYSGVVGNKAIQEVVAAKSFYNGDIAVVATNSTFTLAAKTLARKNKVILVDKSGLPKIYSLLV